MPDALYEEWSDVAALAEAWRRVRRNKGAAGGDGQTLTHFGRDLRRRLQRLMKDLQTGRYAPGPLRRVALAKPDGGERILAIPCVRDRVVQSAVAAALDRRLDAGMFEASFAYRKGRSVEHAAGLVIAYRLRGYHWAVDGDIEKYFDNILHDILLNKVKSCIESEKTEEIIQIWLRKWSQESKGVAQGSPLSPFLANLYLTEVDRRMDSPNARLIRYADDFLILTRTRSEAQDARDRMATLLAPLGLKLHPEKTRILSLYKGVDFLGVTFRGLSVKRSKHRVG